MKKIILFVVLFTLGSAGAATVEWNRIDAVDTRDWEIDPIWRVRGSSQGMNNIYFAMLVINGELGGLVGATSRGPTLSTIWVRQMETGEIADYDSLIGTDGPYFYRNEYGTSVQCDYEALFDAEGKIYLALATLAWSGTGDDRVYYPAYGWMELARDSQQSQESLIVVSSAWDVDGGAMIVGGGAIPEPTSALLLAVGCAFLALRRKRYVA